MKTSCQAHCRTCDEHFAGVTAFDMHRGGMKCHDPAGVEGLYPYEDRVCHISTEKVRKGVTVWSTVQPT